MSNILSGILALLCDKATRSADTEKTIPFGTHEIIRLQKEKKCNDKQIGHHFRKQNSYKERLCLSFCGLMHSY